MKLIKIKAHYYLLSNEEPKLFEPVICPVIKDNVWDGKSFEVDKLTSDLMPLHPNEFASLRTILASTDKSIPNIPIIDRLELIKLGIEKAPLVDKLAYEFCKEHLPHVDTTGHWLGFFKGWKRHEELNKGKEYSYQDMTDLVSQLMDYTKESRCILGHDEREPSEFVDVFINGLPKKNEITEWDVVVETETNFKNLEKDNILTININNPTLLIDNDGYIKIKRITYDKFAMWGTYDNWKEKNANRLSRDYDNLIKIGYGKSFNFYCCGRWDENEL